MLWNRVGVPHSTLAKRREPAIVQLPSAAAVSCTDLARRSDLGLSHVVFQRMNALPMCKQASEQMMKGKARRQNVTQTAQRGVLRNSKPSKQAKKTVP